MTEERLNQSIMEAFIDAYIKGHPGVTREEAAKEVAKLTQNA